MSHGFVALYHNDKLSINSGSRFGNAITRALMGISGHYDGSAKILRGTPDFFVASSYISSIQGITQGNTFVNMLQHGSA